MNYEKLRDPKTAKELPIEFRKEFEEALSKAIGYWQQNGFLVDQFEDNAMECSFAKGFLAGCIYMENKNKNKKVMTQEEKAKAYDEAIERARYWAKCPTVWNSDDICQKIFPELVESEENRIKRCIGMALTDVSEQRFTDYGTSLRDCLAWLEKQSKCETDSHQKHQDANYPNGCIVLEDFNGGEGFYKLNLDYLNKKQVEEIEEMIRVWNKEPKDFDDNIIKDCIALCLTDTEEQRFNDYNTSLKDCLAWLEKLNTEKDINLIELLKHYPKETKLYSPLYGELWLAKVYEEDEIIVCYKHKLSEGCTRATLEQEDTVSFYSNGTTGLPDNTITKDCVLFLYGPTCLEKQKQVEWTEEDEGNRSFVESLIVAHTSGVEQERNLINWLKSLKERFSKEPANTASTTDGDTSVTNKEVVSQQTGWSKEDIDFKTESVRYLCNLRDTFEENKWGTKPIQRCINWLLEFPKPQPKQEWSEEDESTYVELVKYFESLLNCVATEERHNENRRWLNWLKSIKDRVHPKQEWSNEDEEELMSLIGFLHYNGMYDSINFLRNKLKMGRE